MKSAESGTSVWEVPVHLKDDVLNLALCLLPAKAAASEILLLGWRFESWKRSLLLGLCIPRVVCLCVRVCVHGLTHTCLRAVSSWAKACLWTRMVAGWFWFCLAPWEAWQIFLLERMLLLIGDEKPSHHPCYADSFARAASHQRPNLQWHTARVHVGSGNYRCAGRSPFALPPGPAVEAWELVWGAAGCRGLPALFMPHLPGIVYHASEQ